jgi:outer membrane protein assembly factor BamB
LQIPEVRDELKLDESQARQVEALLGDFQRQMASAFGGFNFQELQDLSDEQRNQRFAEMRTKTEEASRQLDSKLSEVLKVPQSERLKQLRLQREGTAAFDRAEIAKELGLTDEQRDKIGDIREDQADGPPFGLSPERRKAIDDAVLAALSDDQKSKWAGLTGKEFKFPEPQGFGGRGGFGRGGGGFGPPGGGYGGGAPPNAVYRWEVHCLDRNTGRTLWKKTAREGKPTIPTQSSNTYASETPVTDGERVYAYFGMHGVYCFDFEGQLVWQKELGSYPMMAGWGTGSSPALDGERLFIQCDNEQKSFLVALNKRNGDELWRVDRDEKSNWSTPFIWRAKGRTEVVACGGNRVRAYDAADGKLLWELGGLTGSCNATPVADDELLYVGCGGRAGSSGPLFAIRAGATGDITLKDRQTSNEGVAWSQPRGGPPMASPLLYQGYLYILEQRGGMVSCYKAKTGEPAYNRKRIPEAGGFTSSPWAYDGKVFCLDDGGQTTVIKAGPQFEVLGKNTLEEMCWSTPAFADGTLLLRSVDHLYCFKP